jgi:lipopolysaccharide export system permease protein
MRIITRYLVRAHAGPFFFALTVLTGLVFLNAIAMRVEDLAGKGLPAATIAEFLLLTLPHVIALTLPMSVLVAILYTFSQLTAGNEITAMSAGGVRPRAIVVPMLSLGIMATLVMLFFNDQVLPETNHRLRNLMVDIGRKSPTFQLREQISNEITSDDGETRVFLTASTIDPETSELREVVIHDLSEYDRLRSIYADSGTMAFNAERTDLYLTLFDGELREVGDDRPGQFNRLFFKTQVVPLRNISNVLERSDDVQRRSDREMSLEELLEAAGQERVEHDRVAEESLGRSRYALRRALGIPGRSEALDEFDLRALGIEADDEGGEAAGAAELQLGDGGGVSSPSPARQRNLRRDDGITQTVAMNHRTNATRSHILELQQRRYHVEVHKKLSISFACIVFVLIGAPMAIRFPRGGVGMVIGTSVAIFAVYWLSLIGGERLADRGLMTPFWSMWIPNFIFLAVGIWMTARMGREVSTTRGGGWDDLLHTLWSMMTLRGFRQARKGAAA